MQKVILGIGIPGSGKTTVLQKFADTYDYAYICPDDIRAELLGDVTDQSRGDEVWKEAYQRTANALAEGKSVVFDATFTNEAARMELIQFAREHGAEKIQGVHVDTPLEVAKERNQERERVVPEHVLERMHNKLQEQQPEISEGFDTIFTLNESQELEKTEREGEQIKLSRR